MDRTPGSDFNGQPGFPEVRRESPAVADLIGRARALVPWGRRPIAGAAGGETAGMAAR
jgi:hypothetical protein